MRHEVWVVVVGAVGLLAAGALPLHAAVTVPAAGPEASIVVRTYTPRDSARDIVTARRTAGDILERAGIRVRWIECGLPEGAAATVPGDCEQPLRRNELVVRIVPAGPVGGRPHVGSLGFAFVDGTDGGWLATVYADRVGTMARAAGVDPAGLLGRAIAHEIGHLLLGTNQHAPHGLMRASWSGADLRRNRGTQWLFGGKEGEVMRRGIASRFRS
jgi:hypothetical protein